MVWDYSELSRLAKLNGGPTELLAKHAAHNFMKGARSKTPVIIAASLIGLGVGIGGTAYYYTFRKKKGKSENANRENQKIEDELIMGMERAAQEATAQTQPHLKNGDDEVLNA